MIVEPYRAYLFKDQFKAVYFTSPFWVFFGKKSGKPVRF
jgi:hypothetical protein